MRINRQGSRCGSDSTLAAIESTLIFKGRTIFCEIINTTAFEIVMDLSLTLVLSPAGRGWERGIPQE
jgi:hypothetical protein